jgi:mono/diheme cytochrome c family protein
VKLNRERVAALFLAGAIAIPSLAQSAGGDIYKSKCIICHGADGLGGTPSGKALKAASFKDPALVKAPDTELFAAIKNGKNKMPPYGGKLTDAEIKQVLAYVRTLQK